MTQQDVGPIDYLALEFPGARLNGEGLAALVDLTDRGIIRILDLVVATVAEDGSFAVVEITDLDGDGDARPRRLRGRPVRAARRGRHRPERCPGAAG